MGFLHAKEGIAVDTSLKGRKRSGNEDQSFDETIVCFDLYEKIHYLSDMRRLDFFLNTFRSAARSNFLRNCTSDISFRRSHDRENAPVLFSLAKSSLAGSIISFLHVKKHTGSQNKK